MILEYVANRAGLFVEWPPALDAYTLGSSDLNVINVIPVPDRLEDFFSSELGTMVPKPRTIEQDVKWRILERYEASLPPIDRGRYGRRYPPCTI
jgi:hypothetical protein